MQIVSFMRYMDQNQHSADKSARQIKICLIQLG